MLNRMIALLLALLTLVSSFYTCYSCSIRVSLNIYISQMAVCLTSDLTVIYICLLLSNMHATLLDVTLCSIVIAISIPALATCINVHFVDLVFTFTCAYNYYLQVKSLDLSYYSTIYHVRLKNYNSMSAPCNRWSGQYFINDKQCVKYGLLP